VIFSTAAALAAHRLKQPVTWQRGYKQQTTSSSNKYLVGGLEHCFIQILGMS
jgi:hypothetical protein